jgi:carbonic anhydrase
MNKCDAVVVCCIDFRFQKFIRRWTDENLAGKEFDLVGFAGSTKDLETVIKQIDISVKLHHVKQAILIHHEDCGAYGTESTPERHATDLRLASQKILKIYPQLEVKLMYLHLNGFFEMVK